ncbi:uncharacterized protein M421DRAFT_427147 [Didymella exigua CBS 183.55]|uniref:Uncharacterized protein n=1 Tax=Didymella exigua CBS 183.55 TaxID=1150837 RepID=A0A6A5R506_9PLEO|nr:uncharacterized protein M421DRAFT_427147 [Didymella exigua CBS 183.55]KAF1922228.1 hypothetical protein M421DRAFT_427147 [Didymella exigua CBS 183.55]
MRYSTFAVSFVFGAQLVAATSVSLSTVPSLNGVSAEAVVELLSWDNTDDFSAVNATQWATFLDQPHDVLAAWDDKTTHRMFSLLHSVLDVDTGLEKRAATPAEAKIQIATKKTLYDNEVTTDEKQDSDATVCLKSAICIVCISGAGTAAIGSIAACATAALAAEVFTAPETAGLSTGPVITAFIECASIPIASFLTAAIGCLEAVKHAKGNN